MATTKLGVARIQVIVGDEEDQVSIADLMRAYRELAAAEESLEGTRGIVQAAKERVKRARSDLNRLFDKLAGQLDD